MWKQEAAKPSESSSGKSGMHYRPDTDDAKRSTERAFIRFTARFAFTGWTVPTKQFAFGHDELPPVSLGGVGDDLAGWGASLVDALGTLVRRKHSGQYALPPASPHLPPLLRPSPDALSALLTLPCRRRQRTSPASGVACIPEVLFRFPRQHDHLILIKVRKRGNHSATLHRLDCDERNPSQQGPQSITVVVGAFACTFALCKVLDRKTDIFRMGEGQQFAGNCVLDDECVQEDWRTRGQGKGNGARLRWQSLVL
ncbi:hypothetical protein FB45DRAFT_1010401 [Roridomyces roridus]|uniref:Uncharacterized protein n=1 Tax=Roridomyces roridus TaxID=1738132 RepID=A0AAD7FBT5_9AGAR|nr:hypothetical protein FB45DRAFT_1010401 [Roridomyces roridus]